MKASRLKRREALMFQLKSRAEKGQCPSSVIRQEEFLLSGGFLLLFCSDLQLIG
jgi:hypothetical protein